MANDFQNFAEGAGRSHLWRRRRFGLVDFVSPASVRSASTGSVPATSMSPAAASIWTFRSMVAKRWTAAISASH